MRYTIGLMGIALFAGGALAQESPELRQQFEMLDQNRDGIVTQQELDGVEQQVLRELNLETPMQFEAADLNRDGQLNESEFSAFETPFPVE